MVGSISVIGFAIFKKVLNQCSLTLVNLLVKGGICCKILVLAMWYFKYISSLLEF